MIKKEDLDCYSHEELKNVFVNFINDMEKTGNESMNAWNEQKLTDDYHMEKYSYAAALLTKVNRIKAMIRLEQNNRELK